MMRRCVFHQRDTLFRAAMAADAKVSPSAPQRPVPASRGHYIEVAVE